MSSVSDSLCENKITNQHNLLSTSQKQTYLSDHFITNPPHLLSTSRKNH